MTRVHRFFKGSRRERSVFVRAFVWVFLYRIGLWVSPFSTTRKWTVGYLTPTSPAHDDQVIHEIARGVKFASRFIPYASCLTQALAARKLLAQYGHQAELKIGVAKTTSDLEAHAWLEIGGRIVLGRQRMHSRYVVLASSATVLRQADRDYPRSGPKLVDEI